MTKQSVVAVTVGAIVALITFGLGFLIGGGSMAIVDQSPPERMPTGSAQFHAKISMVRTDKDLNLQLQEWTVGDAAEQAALVDGVCSLRTIEDDECRPNGFFLRTTNTSLTLPLARSVRIKLFDYTNPQGIMLREIRLEELMESSQLKYDLETRPFIITTRGGVITEIEEQYIP